MLAAKTTNVGWRLCGCSIKQKSALKGSLKTNVTSVGTSRRSRFVQSECNYSNRAGDVSLHTGGTEMKYKRRCQPEADLLISSVLGMVCLCLVYILSTIYIIELNQWKHCPQVSKQAIAMSSRTEQSFAASRGRIDIQAQLFSPRRLLMKWVPSLS